MSNELRLKEALQRLCGLHDQKGDFWSAMADAKALLHELYPEHTPHFEYQWRKIEGFSKYEVSTKGEVRLAVKGFNRPKGHMMKGCVKPKGYTQYGLLNDDGKQKDCMAHRLVAKAFYGDCPHRGWVVAHLDGNPMNNDVHNLKWVSNSDFNVSHGVINKIVNGVTYVEGFNYE